MIAHLLQIIVLISAIVIVARSEPVLNRMGRCTPFMIRTSFHLLSVGAIAEIVCIIIGEVPSWSTAIVSIGIASLLVCEQRVRLFCRLPRNTS